MSNDEIADRVAIAVQCELGCMSTKYVKSIEATDIMNTAEAYRLAFAPDAIEWMRMRREMEPVRRLVFKKLGLMDCSFIEKF